MELTVIEKPYKDTSYKEVYVVDFNLVQHLKNNSYKVKRMDVVKAEDGQCRVVLQTMNYSNSWIDSNLEAMEVAKDAPIYVVRDTDVGVYEAHKAEGAKQIEITDEDIEIAYLNAFQGYEVDSLDHAVLQGLMEIDVSADVVDDEVDDNEVDDSVEKEASGFCPELTEEDIFLDDVMDIDNELDWESHAKKTA